MRSRIFGWQVVLVLAALGGSAGTTHVLLTERLVEGIDRDLRQQVAELRTLAATGVDPVTERRFDDVGQLLRTSIERSVPNRNETLLALVDGAVVVRSATEPPVRLDTDPALVRGFWAAAGGRVTEADTTRGRIRYAAVPVTVAGREDQRGVYVVAVFRDLEARDNRAVTAILLLVGLVALALVGAVAWVLSGRMLAPVLAVRDTAREITETDLSRRIDPAALSGDDEVVDLARTFNTMLDRLDTAFTAQRDFMNDAGHELRTPLTIVRGHLELLGDDPQERRETVNLVTDELDRMARIIDDLLLLARAQRRELVTPAPVEVVGLGQELLEKARMLGERDWRLECTASGVVQLDRQRLSQAVLQLADNAVRHTRPGDPITLGVQRTATASRWWVQDGGPGVAPADRDRIFDRFTRGPDRSSGSGAGLGLAIVRAIARAHGGEVWVEDSPTGGAWFIIELPQTSGRPR